MYLIDQYCATCLSCRYQIPQRLASADKRADLEHTATAAVADVILKHPMLQVAIKDEKTKKPSWVHVPELDLREHIQWLYVEGDGDDFAQNVQRVFVEQLDDMFPSFDRFLPGWKMTFVRHHQGGDVAEMEVLLTWNHPQFDGAGARIIHEDFLASLNSMLTSIDHNSLSGDQVGCAYDRKGLDRAVQRLTIPDSPLPNLPLPLEVVAKLPVDIKHLVRTVYQELRPPFLSRDPSVARWCPIRSNVAYKTQFRHFDIPAESLGVLLRRCRQNRTTVTGLINALALVAFSRHLGLSQAPAFQSSTVMDHRRNLPPGGSVDGPWGGRERVVANYVTQLPHKHDAGLVARIRALLSSALTGEEHAGNNDLVPLSPELVREVWSVSMQSRREITAQLELGLKNDIVGIFKYVGDWQSTMRDMAKRPRQFTWLVTNLGVLHGRARPEVIDGDKTKNNEGGSQIADRWSITRAQFGLSAETPAGAIEFSPVSVAGGGMVMGANWHDSAVDVKLGERVVRDLHQWLSQLATGV